MHQKFNDLYSNQKDVSAEVDDIRERCIILDHLFNSAMLVCSINRSTLFYREDACYIYVGRLQPVKSHVISSQNIHNVEYYYKDGITDMANLRKIVAVDNNKIVNNKIKKLRDYISKY